MFNWAKQQLANVAGTQEPIYGPSAIQTVTEQSKDVPYTELKKEDLKWTVMDSTSVETQAFYFTADNGHLGMAQIIYSNVAGIRTTCQFNSKIFYPNQSKPPLWSSKPLENYEFDEDKYSFLAENCSVELSADGNSYTIKSATDDNALVNLKVTRKAPGFVAGKNGRSNFGTDPTKPWGTIWHKFWPRCDAEGAIITKDGEVNFKGRALFIHAMQGMKPHHAAAKWNFVSFQSPDYSAIMMQFTTPPSYGSTVVTVGGLVQGDKIVLAGTSCDVKHSEIKGDPENEWPEPGALEVKWEGTSKDGKPVSAELNGSLAARIDRIDVMAEVPGFVKAIVAQAAGTKPYIYQFTPKLKLKVIEDGKTIEQDGQLFMEATFIS